MIHFNITAKDYDARVSRSIRRVFIFAVIFFFITLLLAESVLMAAMFTVLILITQIPQQISDHHYLIEEIKMIGSEVDIVYTDKQQRKEFRGSLSEASFKLRFGFGGRSPNLSIYNKGKLLLTQFNVEGWDEVKFNEIMEEVRINTVRM